MRKAWITLTGLFLAVALAGFVGASCDSGDGSGDDCATTCEGKECGTIGDCTCGTCGEGELCGEDNMCAAEQDCTAACEGLDCGTVNGCECGACGEGEECSEENMCQPAGVDCTAACEGKTCGTTEDGCECGTCAEGETCNETTFTCECQPQCTGEDGSLFECGDDGCGDVCGTCSGNGECVDNMCICTPACDGKECGPDGCGGTCGDCGDDVCQEGTCVAAGDCSTAVAPKAENVQKVVYMEVGKGGHPGEALDVDGDADTCAPEGDCEDGLNNQLSGLLGQLSQFVDADAEIANALTEGSIILLADLIDPTMDGSEFLMNMYIAELDPANEACDFQAEKCDYLVSQDSLDPVSCAPIIKFENTTITDGMLMGGGPDALFKVTIPVQEGIILDVTANMAQVTGTVTGDGDAMKIEDGLIGGAVRKDKLMEAVDLIPEDAELPVSKDMIKNLLDMFVQPDVDTDGDDDPDAASIGVKFSTIAGAISGVEPTE